ncbi:MAG: hypothetical protein MJ246_07995 [Clostridia bacterium]|nr:hypothetical protein [Clostridia bacterium]
MKKFLRKLRDLLLDEDFEPVLFWILFVIAFLIGCSIFNKLNEAQKPVVEAKEIETSITVENQVEGVEIRALPNGIKVYKDIPKLEEEIEANEEEEEIHIQDLSGWEEILKYDEIPAPKIYRVYKYETELKSCTRNVYYELCYDQFIEELCQYKEDEIVRYLVLPDAVFTIERGPEIHQLGYNLYYGDFVSRWAAPSFYMQNLITMYSDIEDMIAEYGTPDDPYFNIQPYVDYGDYQDTFENEYPENGPFINFDEKTLRVKVRYNILDTFTGECYYSDYSDEVSFGKEEAPFDISQLEPIEFSDNFTVTTAEIRVTPNTFTNTFDSYLTVRLAGYEEDMDKALDKTGEVVAVFEVYDKLGLRIDQEIYDLAYLDKGIFNYYFDWYEVNPDNLDFSDIKCRVKLVYVYDIINAYDDMEFASESKWLYFDCK